MPKRSELPTSRRHISLFDEDWEFLEAAYGQNSKSKLGAGHVIRRIVHTYVKTLKGRAQELAAQGAKAQIQESVDA